jgi:hypothetical protein
MKRPLRGCNRAEAGNVSPGGRDISKHTGKASASQPDAAAGCSVRTWTVNRFLIVEVVR